MQTSIAKWLTKPATLPQQPDAVSLDDTPHAAPVFPEAQAARLTGLESPVQETEPVVAPQVQYNVPIQLFARRAARPIPFQVSITPITADLIPSFRRLNSLLLQIPYQDKFFKDTIDDEVIASISRAALWTADGAKPRLVGAIRCRLLAPPNASVGPSLYISTVGTLSPYRSHGLATALLDDVMRGAIEDYRISSVSAHVWGANVEGLEWYAKRGFKEVGREEAYYRRLDPSTAIMIRRDVSVTDMLPRTGGSHGHG